MKKWKVLFISIATVMALTACGSKAEQTDEQEETVATSEETTESEESSPEEESSTESESENSTSADEANNAENEAYNAELIVSKGIQESDAKKAAAYLSEAQYGKIESCENYNMGDKVYLELKNDKDSILYLLIVDGDKIQGVLDFSLKVLLEITIVEEDKASANVPETTEIDVAAAQPAATASQPTASQPAATASQPATTQPESQPAAQPEAQPAAPVSQPEAQPETQTATTQPAANVNQSEVAKWEARVQRDIQELENIESQKASLDADFYEYLKSYTEGQLAYDQRRLELVKAGDNRNPGGSADQWSAYAKGEGPMPDYRESSNSPVEFIPVN